MWCNDFEAGEEEVADSEVRPLTGVQPRGDLVGEMSSSVVDDVRN
jgi:hypothetical protein